MDYQFKTRLAAIRQQDPRQTTDRFLQTFGLAQVVTVGKLTMLLRDARPVKDARLGCMLDNALTLYAGVTYDYRGVVLADLQQLRADFEWRHQSPQLSNQALANAIGLSRNYVTTLFEHEQPLTKTKAILVDALKYDLIPLEPIHIDDLFATMLDYDRLQRTLLRAQFGDGMQVRSLNVVSKLTGIRVIELRHLEMRCHNFNAYAKALTGLAKIQMPLGGDL